MDKMQSFYSNLTKKLDLPAEPFPGITVAEVWGDGRILIENHRGVIGYLKDEIAVRTSYGSLQIKGNDLQLTMMTREQLIISGNIADVILKRG